jgi:hypothetical protein
MQHGGDFHLVFRILRINDGAPRVAEMHGRFRTAADASIQSFIDTLTDIT